MALSNDKITTSLVGNTLGSSSRDVGTLCTHPNVNKWSKRKPFQDTRISLTGEKWWRRSDISSDIRSGFYISNLANVVWEYARPNNVYRLGDFRGYDHGAELQASVNFPNDFSIYDDYEASVVFTGYIAVQGFPDVGAIGLQDIFDLENKYCCLCIDLRSTSQYVTVYSDRILHGYNVLFGQQITIPVGDLSQLFGHGGEIVMRIFMIEADDYVAGQFLNPKEYSIRANENLQTQHYNNQFRRQGYIVYSNFDTQQPTKTATHASSTGYEQVAFSASFRTGGSVSGYVFQARIINNQIGTNYTYNFPSFTLNADDTQLFTIPPFSIQILDPTKEVLLEYSVWDGAPNSSNMILSKTYKLQ